MNKYKVGVGVKTTNFIGYEARVCNVLAKDTILIGCNNQISIAKDTNTLISELYHQGCSIFFLFDDDCFPIKQGWEQFFIHAYEIGMRWSMVESRHFILGNDEHLHRLNTAHIGEIENDQPTNYYYSYFEKGTGCMMFLTREVIDKVGYLNTKYGKYGYEHAAYSWRIHKAGLTPSWYVSVDGWEEYVYSWDLQKEEAEKHNFVKQEWSTQDEKQKYIAENESIFNHEISSPQIYYPYDQEVKVIKRTSPNKPKVLFFAPDKTDNTSFWRMNGVLPYLNQTDFELKDVSDTTTFSWADFVDVSVLIFQRPCLEWHVDAILLAQSMGVKVISDFDDNLLCVDDFNVTYKFYRDQRKTILRAIHVSDEVWVTTEPIRTAYLRFNKNIIVIKNAWNDYLFPKELKKDFNPKTKTVLWRGGKTHYSDIDDVKEQLVEVINGNQDWSFSFWGELLIFLHIAKRVGGNCTIMEPMSTKQYFDALIKTNPNIVIFPLSNTMFNECKSNIAWMECIYSGGAFFGGIGSEFEKPGIADFEHLKDELSDPDFEVLKEANECSWQYILDNCLLSQVNQLRLQQIKKYL